MNPESNNDFDQLRKVLALKRYELPPPRYFNDFSTSVIARLSRPQREELSWWQRLGFALDLRPAAMCGVGIVACGLLSFGLIGGMHMVDADSPAFAGSNPMGNPILAATPTVASFNTSIYPVLKKDSASPFNQLALGATPATFRFANPSLGN